FCWDLGQSGSTGATPVGRLFQLITSVLERGESDGTLRLPLRPVRLAQTVILLATSMISTAARLPRPARVVSLIRTEMESIYEIILRGLAAEGTDQSLLILPRQEATSGADHGTDIEAKE
ncbi:MAG TPA: hypothetical protein VLH39_04635, partial [Magnetospirillaceae bacterium]|nr:hypothetical protein [Magnetospirillaceae bacterium]